LLVDRRPLDGRDFRFELEPRDVFVGKSANIIRSLLTDRDRVWVQSELVSRTKASSGMVSRIVQHLIRQGFLEKQSAREFRLCDPLGLIDAWVKADDFNRRSTITRYTALGGNPIEVARQLESSAKEQSVQIAFTQWIGGWLRHPYTEPVVTSAYVARLPEADTLERLGLRPVNDAGKVWLYVPKDGGVFLETQTVQNLPLVSDAQIYLDLQGTGLRGPDQAAALRQWKGFCRP
jgi:DNA-binding MarR family transcriptional regulator